MKTVRISLNSIDKVKSFVNDLSKFDVDFDLVSGRYVIDAKSIMGIFSLDLSKPIDLNIHAESDVDTILGILAPYIIDSVSYTHLDSTISPSWSTLSDIRTPPGGISFSRRGSQCRYWPLACLLYTSAHRSDPGSRRDPLLIHWHRCCPGTEHSL